MKKKNIIFWAILIVALIVIGCITKPDFTTISNGVITSIIASLLFLIFTTLVDNSNDEIKSEVKKASTEISEVSQKISNGLKSIQDLEAEIQYISNELSKISEYVDANPDNLRKKLGIIRIENRKEYSYEFWASFLKDALEKKSKKFIISGRTLHRWLENGIVDDFKNALLKLIDEKAEIDLVIYSRPKDAQKKTALQKFLNKEIFPHLVNACGRDLNEINKVFRIYEVKSLPYLYTAIDSQVVVAQYFNNTSNSENIMLVLSPECPFAHKYLEDFNAIQKNQSDTWIKTYLQQMKGSKNETK